MEYTDIKMFLWVIFCLILIIGLFFVIIKVIAQKNKYLMAGRTIKTIGGVSLGQNKSLQVVEIGHSLYIVGVGDNVQFISKIDDPVEVEYIQDRILSRNTKELPVVQYLAKWMKGFQKQNHLQEEKEQENLSSSFQQVFNEKMGQISNRKQKVNELFQEDIKVDRLNDK